MLETKKQFSLVTGISFLKGTGSNLFYPSTSAQAGFGVESSYSQKILPWLDGGLSAVFFRFSESEVTDETFGTIHPSGEMALACGPIASFHLPYKSAGIFNHLGFNLNLSPQFLYFSGKRTAVPDNEVVVIGEGTIKPQFSTNKSNTVFAYRISPEIYYRFSQKYGIKLTYAQQFFTLNTTYTNETVTNNSVMVGLIYSFGQNLLLFN